MTVCAGVDTCHIWYVFTNCANARSHTDLEAGCECELDKEPQTATAAMTRVPETLSFSLASDTFLAPVHTRPFKPPRPAARFPPLMPQTPSRFLSEWQAPSSCRQSVRYSGFGLLHMSLEVNAVTQTTARSFACGSV